MILRSTGQHPTLHRLQHADLDDGGRQATYAVRMSSHDREGPDARPETIVGWTLVQAYQVMARRFHAAFAEVGLTAHEFGVLVRLNLQPGASQAALAREVFVTPQSMGPIIRRLVEIGLVRRSPPVSRGNPAALELTDSGRAKLGVAFPRIAGINAPAALGLSREEADRLDQLLRRLRDHLRAADGS